MPMKSHRPISISRPGRPRNFSSLTAERVGDPSNRVQIYVSRATDPYVNLSIEHFLLQKSHPESVVLLLYANRPCVVIGRNQNPWVEVNLGQVRERGVLARLRREAAGATTEEDDGPRDHDDDVLLVRRRSGGGAVFHDAGNANWSVLCAPAVFDRDRHAAMVVRALGSLGVAGARVNERHDIVLDVPCSTAREVDTFKVSGSAYKLTRTRSLHHGTCLLRSRHLAALGALLRSPAAPFIRARGVESVRSPVRNVGVPGDAFRAAVVREFAAMYDEEEAGRNVVVLDGPEEALPAEVREGVRELRSRDWLYAQTPQFEFSSHATEADPRPRPPLPASLPADFRGAMTVRHGRVTAVDQTGYGSVSGLPASFKDLLLHEVEDWRKLADEPVGEWLNGLFGIRKGE
ncbi:hypothetical protein F4780DRAFT_784623 [Xylariomycetidae sp. FL0641]|nr:hypothetical protein F4780DRAFT_784623 [Xylariomycetidae sp. FL0641]